MMKAPPPLPTDVLRRVLFIARFDGWSVVAIAAVFALLAAAMRDYVGAGMGVAISGAGLVELHGVALLRRGEARGMTWLILSQFLLMAGILAYCALRLAYPMVDSLRAAITPEMKMQLETIGWSVEEFLRLVYRLTYYAVALTSVVYQGGMALYYVRRRRVVAEALDLPPILRAEAE